MSEHGNHDNALEFGKSSLLATVVAVPELDTEHPWSAIWMIQCPCGCSRFQPLDFAGQIDRVDTTFWIECTNCQAVHVIFSLTEVDDELEGFERDLLEPVCCSRCQRSRWQLREIFNYPDDLQETLEDDAPEEIDRLAEHYEWIRIVGTCECGHQVELLSYEF